MGEVMLMDYPPSKEKVEEIEKMILELPQVDLQTSHVLAHGVYARTIIIPAGTVLTGAAHKFDHINIMQGDVTCSTDDGMKRLTGHHVLMTKAGNKRVGYVHSDTIWTTVCHTHLTEISEIEEELVEEPEKLQTRTLALVAKEQSLLKEN